MIRGVLPVLGLLLIALAATLSPLGALAGWRAGFVALGAVPTGAITLLLVARLTGATWDAALLPLAAPAWLLLPAFLPVVIGQALTVPRPAHLALWLAWPFFLARGLVAIGLWTALVPVLRRGGPSPSWAGLHLVAHGVVLTIVGTDWLLGPSPGQPQSAIAMVMATAEISAACAAACLLGLGSPAVRRDLSFLLIAAALGLAYLLFMDFLIVWYGNLPPRVGWYVDRARLPWALLPPSALLAGVLLPIAAVGLVRTEGARRLAGAGALVAVLAIAGWFCAPPLSWALVAVAGTALVGTAAWARA